MKVHQLTEFSIYLQQRPGELAGVLDAATAAGVDIFSISTTEHLDRGCVRVLGYPEDALRHVCESLVEAGIGPVVESPVVAVSITDRPGVVRDLTVLMADNRINVRYCYLIPGDRAYPQAMCVFRFDEHDRALEVIEQADIPEISSLERNDDEVGGESAA